MADAADMTDDISVLPQFLLLSRRFSKFDRSWAFFDADADIGNTIASTYDTNPGEISVAVDALP